MGRDFGMSVRRTNAVSPAAVRAFRRTVWVRYRTTGRHSLPWRKTKNVYRIFVSEIMLQQTQVSRVVPKYREFLKRFPSFRSLARAPVGDVLRVWQGLGYNRRALNLRAAAEVVVTQYGGVLPKDEESLRQLPGIGPGTAGSLRAFAFDLPVVFIETNIRRAIIHHFFAGQRSVSEENVRAIASAVLDVRKPRAWYSALMDYGAMLGAALPKQANANRRSALYARQPRFKGSDRELRGKIVRLVLRSPLPEQEIVRRTGESRERVHRILSALIREGFARRKGQMLHSL